MRSVADDLRRESRLGLRRLTAAERVRLALALGDDDVALFCAAQSITEAEARARIARARQRGRLPSCAGRS